MCAFSLEQCTDALSKCLINHTQTAAYVLRFFFCPSGIGEESAASYQTCFSPSSKYRCSFSYGLEMVLMRVWRVQHTNLGGRRIIVSSDEEDDDDKDDNNDEGSESEMYA